MKHNWKKAAAVTAAVAVAAGIIAIAPTRRVGPADIYPPADVPGATNPSVTQATINSTICVSGWTATIRPPSSYTNHIKLTDMQKYHLSGAPADYELDHLISLELGGNESDVRNLWMEAYTPASTANGGAHAKDRTENALKAAICSGALTLKAAQDIITSDWYSYYTKNVAKALGGVNNMGDPDDEVVQ